jgi:hypothetical protein
MASAGEKGLAKKVLSQRRSGGGVTNDLAASARRVLDGQARSGDMDAIRAYFNVGRSYAGNIRGVTGSVGRVASIGMNVSRDFEMMQSGSGVAGARALATLGLDVSQEIVRNRRTLIKIGEGVAQTVGADPALASRFFNSLSRIAKVGGVVGAVAIAGFSAANAWFETLKAGGEAGRKMNEAYFTSGNRALASDTQERARGQIGQEALLTPTTGLGFLDDFFQARQEKAASQRMDQMMQHARKSRELTRTTGGAALARYAGTRGKALGDLTQEEINTVLDEESSKFVGSTRDEYFSYTQEKQKELVWWERQLMSVSPHYASSKQHQWSRELNERSQERYQTRLEAKSRAEAEVQRRMSATDRLALLHARDEAAANFSAYRSRHKPVILD